MNLNPIRIGCALTIIIGAIYGSTGLLLSLHDFGIGLAVAAAGAIGYGLCDFLDTYNDDERYQQRLDVWKRRDTEQAAPQSIYSQPRDGINRDDKIA